MMKTNKEEKFFRTAKAFSPEDYLKAALQAEKYLAENCVETVEGIYWELPSANKESFDRRDLLNRMGLYGGSSGILYFYLKLYRVTGEEGYLNTIKKAVSYICTHLSEAFPDKIQTIEENKEKVSLDIGILGVGGIGFVLAEVYESFHWKNALNALSDIKNFYLKKKNQDENGTFWTGSTTMITDTVVLLFLIKYISVFPEEELRKVILSAGEWFLTRQIPLEGEMVRYPGLECVWPGIKPNFEVGTAGSGFMLAKLYEFTGDKRYIETAEKCAKFLHHYRVPQKKGYLIPFRLEQNPITGELIIPENNENPLCYLGTCSGPAGTCRFFYLLYKLTGRDIYLKEIEGLVDGMEALGAPEKMSAGLWHNVNFCCGHAGILQFFTALYQKLGNEHYKELAIRTAGVILGEKEDLGEGAARWQVALERIKPDSLSAPLGYYMGAAGIASSLLQIYLSETGQFNWKRLPDDPFI